MTFRERGVSHDVSECSVPGCPECDFEIYGRRCFACGAEISGLTSADIEDGIPICVPCSLKPFPEVVS